MDKYASSASRHKTPTTSSTSTSDQSSTSASGSEDSASASASGSFDAGFTRANRERAKTKDNDGEAAAAVRANHHDVANLPPCPQPVRRLLQCAAFTMVCGGLASMAYGGVQQMSGDSDVAKNAGLMVSGAAELFIAMIAFIFTVRDPSLTPPVNPA